MARKKKKGLRPAAGARSYEQAMRDIEARVDRLTKEGRGPLRNTAYGWRLKVLRYEPETIDRFCDLAISAAYEIKDLFYSDDPDFEFWLGEVPGAYGERTFGEYLQKRDVIIVNPFVIMECGYDPCIELVNTLGHELVHRWCRLRGIEKLTAVENPELGLVGYHNELFKKHAERHGMTAGLNADGYSNTAFTEDAWTLIKSRCPVTAHGIEEAAVHPLKQRTV